MIGMCRPTSGRIAHLADQVLSFSLSGCTATAASPSMVSGRVVATTMNSLAALDRIFDVPEMALHLDLLHLEVGDRGEQLRVPVDQPLVLVDQALVVERDEHLEDGARQALVHGEALARPVARRAEPLELARRWCRRIPPSRPRPAPGTSRGPCRGGRAPGAPSTAARPPSAWRCRRGRCRAATARPCRACARSAPGCPAACC